MGQIIELSANRDRKLRTAVDSFDIADKEFETAAYKYMENDNEENLASVLRSMGSLAREALKNPHLKEYMEESDRLYMEFKERYKTVIDNAPKFDSGLRMQYFAQVMLGFVDLMFHGDENKRKGYFSDFADFHTLFDDAYSDFMDQYKNLEELYHFHGNIVSDASALEEMITDCLKNIVQLHPNDNDEEKTKLMLKASELFEVYRSILYFFTDD